MLKMSYYGNYSKSEFESLPLILQRFSKRNSSLWASAKPA